MPPVSSQLLDKTPFSSDSEPHRRPSFRRDHAPRAARQVGQALKKSRPKGVVSVKQSRMITVTLNAAELAILFRQDPATKDDGGWQRLLITLQELTDETSGEIIIPARIIERI